MPDQSLALVHVPKGGHPGSRLAFNVQPRTVAAATAA